MQFVTSCLPCLESKSLHTYGLWWTNSTLDTEREVSCRFEATVDVHGFCTSVLWCVERSSCIPNEITTILAATTWRSNLLWSSRPSVLFWALLCYMKKIAVPLQTLTISNTSADSCRAASCIGFRPSIAAFHCYVYNSRTRAKYCLFSHFGHSLGLTIGPIRVVF